MSEIPLTNTFTYNTLIPTLFNFNPMKYRSTTDIRYHDKFIFAGDGNQNYYFIDLFWQFLKEYLQY